MILASDQDHVLRNTGNFFISLKINPQNAELQCFKILTPMQVIDKLPTSHLLFFFAFDFHLLMLYLGCRACGRSYTCQCQPIHILWASSQTSAKKVFFGHFRYHRHYDDDHHTGLDQQWQCSPYPASRSESQVSLVGRSSPNIKPAMKRRSCNHSYFRKSSSSTSPQTPSRWGQKCCEAFAAWPEANLSCRSTEDKKIKTRLFSTWLYCVWSFNSKYGGFCCKIENRIKKRKKKRKKTTKNKIKK